MFIDRIGAAAIWGLVNHIATALVAEEHGVVYCRLNDGREVKEPPPPDGVDLVDIDVPSKTRVWDLHRQAITFAAGFRPLLRDLRPDVVHTHFCVPGVVARHVARQEGVPIIMSTQHEMFGSLFPHYRWAVRFTERCTDATVYVSETVADSFRRKAEPLIGSTEGPWQHVVIHNGVDLAQIDAVRSGVLPRDPLKIVCTGRMVEKKGHDVLLRAMPKITECFPDVRLVLIGAGPQQERLQGLVSECGLERNVASAGWLPHEAALREVASAAASIAPSAGEGFGLVLAEAMACNTQVIASDIGAFREIAGTDQESVHFFDTSDCEGLADRVCRVLGDPVEASLRAAFGRQRIERRFSVNRMVGDYLRLYDFLAARGLEVSCV
jgi:glycosyltransferase involved in cell wall biosynthesis